MRRLLATLAALCLALGTAPAVLAAPPANDLPGGAIVVPPTIPGTVAQDTTEATVGADDVGCGAGGVDQATVWYTFTPATDGTILIDASASDYLVGINVFAGEASADALVVCFEVGGTLEVTAGTTYYLMFADIDGDATNGGQLSVAFDEAPPPIEVTLTVDPVGRVDQRSGTAVLTGTMTCSEEAETAFLDISLAQRVGRFTIRAFGSTETTCGPDPVTWSAEVSPENGRLSGGRATATIFAVACDQFQCSETEHTATVKLRRGGPSS